MALIVWTSDTRVPYADPGKICPRYEIGVFFVTAYFIAKKETMKARTLEQKLETCLAAKERCMKRCDMHPSNRSSGSSHLGSHEEMHEGEHSRPVTAPDGTIGNFTANNHMHMELIGKARDTHFTDDEMTSIRRVLEEFAW